ncbi:MAG: recombinase family protein [Bradyrhizobium sp.]|nr:recombinase family protein [Bradyrhizobium sp.]
MAKVDRLARSTHDLLNMLHRVKNPALRSRRWTTWLDTTTAHSELLLTVLGGIATCERRLILNRTTKALSGLRPGASKPKLTRTTDRGVAHR